MHNRWNNEKYNCWGIFRWIKESVFEKNFREKMEKREERWRCYRVERFKKIIKLLAGSKKNWIANKEKCEISRFFKLAITRRIKDDTSCGKSKRTNRGRGFWEHVKFFARLAFPATNSKSLVCRGNDILKSCCGPCSIVCVIITE